MNNFTNEEILKIAMTQSALDIGCAPEDFLRTHPKVVLGGIGPSPRVYYREPISCNLVSYGNSVVASAKREVLDLVLDYVHRYPHYHLFESPNLLWFNEHLAQFNQKVCYMAEYWLPDLTKLVSLPCNYRLKVLEKGDFDDCYNYRWSNALMIHRPERDELAVGAYTVGGKLVGLAGCSSDCDTMWQIGVDVLPEYRNQGIASAITSRLALEILERGKVPFYCCAWSNLASARNAIRSGFKPAWVELTVKPSGFVDDANKTDSEREAKP